jgi:hypothetical protein
MPQKIFFKNSPEIACQAPNPLKPFPINNIPLAKNQLQTAIMEIGGNSANLAKRSAGQTISLVFANIWT